MPILHHGEVDSMGVNIYFKPPIWWLTFVYICYFSGAKGFEFSSIFMKFDDMCTIDKNVVSV